MDIELKNKTVKSVAIIILSVTVLLFVASCKDSTKAESPNTEVTESETVLESADSEIQGGGITYEATYDENGNQNGQKIYTSDGNVKSEESWDYLGRVSDITMYNADGTEDAKQHITYDGETDTPKGYETVKYHYSEDRSGLENYNRSFFNANMQKTDERSFNADDALINMCKYEYDDSGNVSREMYYGSEYDLQRITEYEYNENDRLTKEIFKDSAENILTMTGYEYNGDGSISKQLEYDPDGTVRSYCLYVYTEGENAPEEQIYVRGDDREYVRFN